MDMMAALPAVVERWEHFPHGADIGVRGIGADPAAAFEQVAHAVTALLTDRPVQNRERVHIACAAPNLDLLLIDWLQALIFEMATRDLVFGRFAVSIRDGRLEADAWGEPIQGSAHEPAVEIKAATHTQLQVGRRSDGLWCAQCVVDV